jgi:hypothetical protein
VNANQQDRPGQSAVAGVADVWGEDELETLFADPRVAGQLGRILAAAGAPAHAGPLPGEHAARHAFRVAFPDSAARRPRALARMSGRAAAVALCGGLVLSGAAAAAVGGLPDPAQQTAKSMLAKIGLNIPGPHDDVAVDQAEPASTVQRPVTSADPTDTPGGTENSGIGNEVSDLARTTTLTGVDKGAAVSGLASDGKSRAGQHSKPAKSSSGDKTKKPKHHASTRDDDGTDKPKTHGNAHVAHPKADKR